jgi:hypothetical protein
MADSFGLYAACRLHEPDEMFKADNFTLFGRNKTPLINRCPLPRVLYNRYSIFCYVFVLALVYRAAIFHFNRHRLYDRFTLPSYAYI